MKKHFFIGCVLLSILLVGCAPVGKVIDIIQPVGSYGSPGTKFTLSPTTLSLATTDATKTITVTATDRFVHQKIFLCKKPCEGLPDWKEIGGFDGTPVLGTYLDGIAGISKQLELSRDDLMVGNNFLVVFTCSGIGLCNGNKWLLQRFTAAFVECNVDGDCSNGKKCIGEKCISLQLSCIQRLGVCNADETLIYSLSNEIEGHIAKSNSGYPASMCCSTNQGSLSTACGTPFFVGSGADDAHAQSVGTSPAYTTAMNYCLDASVGKISCRTAQSCAAGETCLGSLENTADSHVGACDLFPNKICCRLD